MVSYLPVCSVTSPFNDINIRQAGPDESPVYYNSACLVDRQGNLVTTYQKVFLYKVDEAWAQEGPGFQSMYIEGLGQVRRNWNRARKKCIFNYSLVILNTL
jgi:predicted amidohydrolase